MMLLQNYRRPLLGIAGALCMLAISSVFGVSTAQASILLPPSADLTIEHLSDAPGASARIEGEQSQPQDSPCSPTELAVDEHHAFPASGSTGAGNNGAGGFPGADLATGLWGGSCVMSDDDVVGSTLEELCLALPDPPGSEMLRPPQVMCVV